MAIPVSFSPEDLLRGKIITPGWYLAKIKSVGSKPSKDGGSTNYPVEFVLLKEADSGSEEFSGVPVTGNFNSKAMGFSQGFFKALMGGAELESGKNYDIEAAQGEMIEVFIENDQYEGRMVNRINHKYRPVSSK